MRVLQRQGDRRLFADVAFRHFSDGNVMETEPNDAFETSTAAELPLRVLPWTVTLRAACPGITHTGACV